MKWHLVFFFFSFLSIKGFANTLLAEDYIKQHGLEKSVAQLLMVGITADYNNIETNKATKDILKLNVGGVIINAYNLPANIESNTNNRKQALGIASQFISTIRENHRDGNKLLIAADFESYKYASVHYPLIPPPSSMTITTNNSTLDSKLIGKSVGQQLKSIGVNVLLGPVLDIDMTVQGTRNNNISNRSFGGNKELVSTFSAAFMEGVNTQNIAVFAKHFPGYGFVTRNPHRSADVSVNASIETIIDSLKPFVDTQSLFQGVMTSHLNIDNTNRPLTVSNKTLGELLSRKGLNSIKGKIFITDDLSNMESIKSYRDKNGLSNASIVLNAFKAGHDLMLLSHLNQHSNQEFTLQDVKDSIAAIVQYANTENGSSRLKSALNKILTLKEKLSKKHNNASNDEVNFTEIERLYSKVLSGATISVSNTDKNFSNNFMDIVSSEDPLYIVGDTRYFNFLKKSIPESNKAEYISITKLKKFYKRKVRNNKIIGEIGKDLTMKIKKGGYVLLLLSDVDSFNILDSLRLNGVDTNRLIASVHSSSSAIKTQTLSRFQVISNFDSSPYSSYPLGQILNGDLTPRSIKQAPVKIGNGGYFDLSMRKTVVVDERDSELVLSTIKKNNSRYRYPAAFIIPAMCLLIATVIALSIFSCHAVHNNNLLTRKGFWKDAMFSTEYTIRKILIFFLIVIGAIILPTILTVPNVLTKALLNSGISGSDIPVMLTMWSLEYMANKFL